MPPAYVTALLETAPDGVEFDELSIEPDGERFRFRTPNTDRGTLSETELREVATGSPFVTNWYFWHATAPQKPSRWAFLRWVEDAAEMGVPARYNALSAGSTAKWGQLHVTATLGTDGHRKYELCHVSDARTQADAETESEQLTEYDDPLAARKLAKFDDDGRYRPLKTAPTLQTGWRFEGLHAEELVDAVESFYPATIANWHREREGRLDVTHWHETTQRQTGIYGVVETWDRGDGHEHVEWVGETHCTDDTCLKRREWGYDEETPLDVDGGSGPFPCREPCSLVISAARKYTRLDAEQTKSYEFELTPSEKAQLEELIDAVADGRVGDVREAEFKNGANRYRARFLRARRFDDDGRLCGVKTDEE
jgi:hypothetical protein